MVNLAISKWLFSLGLSQCQKAVAVVLVADCTIINSSNPYKLAGIKHWLSIQNAN